MPRFDVLIVGAGHAGAQAAIMLRQLKFTGSIAIVGEEPELPYERPPLSKEYFSGEKEFERPRIRPPAFWQERDIAMLMGIKVVAVDADAHLVTTHDGTGIGYGLLIWATGGYARMLPIPGGELPGVQGVRTRADADQMKSASERAKHIVVIGGARRSGQSKLLARISERRPCDRVGLRQRHQGLCSGPRARDGNADRTGQRDRRSCNTAKGPCAVTEWPWADADRRSNGTRIK